MGAPEDAATALPGDIVRLRSWLAAVADIVRAVNQARPLAELLDLIAATTCRLTGYDFCAVMLAEAGPPRLAIEGAFGFSADYVARVNVERPIHLLADEPLGDGPTSRAFRSQRPVAVRDIAADPTFGPWADLAAEEGYRSLLCVPIVASGGPLGVLNCYAVEPHAVSPTNRALVETLADAASIAIEAARLRSHELATIADLERLNASLEQQRERTAHEVQSRLSRDLLGDVLSADETIDEWPVQRRASQLGHDLRSPHTVLVVRPDGADGTPDQDPTQLQHRLVGVVRAAVERPGPRPLVAARNENVVVLWSPGAAEGDARRVADHIQRRVREQLGPMTVSVAIGATCRHLQEYASAYRVADAALDLRRRNRGREAVLSLAELGVYQFLLQVRRPQELATYAASLLDPLRAADRAALLPTLRTYLENGLSTAETAKLLYVHVNTVAYRIRRISETLGLDLRDPDVLLNLRFALMIDDILRR